MLNNPYIAGNPVGGTDVFIGRENILRDVLHILDNPHENAIVLYGQRRIGKTSVLKELQTILPSKGHYAPVYLDLQDKAELPFGEVLRELYQRIIYDLDIPHIKNWDEWEWNEEIIDKFQKNILPHVLSKLPKKKSLVLLFDEFDVMDRPLSKKQAGGAFFPYFRNVMEIDSERIKFLFVIGRKPADLSTVYISLFKSVKFHHVSLLSPKDTATLVQISERNNALKWSDDALSHIYNMTGGHPYLTQQLCQIILDNLSPDNSEDITVIEADDVLKAVPKTLKTSTHSLVWLWDGLGAAERLFTSALAKMGPGTVIQEELEQYLEDNDVRIPISELQQTPIKLCDWNLIESKNNGYRFSVEMLRRWIVESKPLSRVKDELERIIPRADAFYQAAFEFYQEDSFKKAIPLLRKVVKLNPNHLKAGKLLTEIYLAEEKIDNALKVCEQFYEYYPAATRPLLIQALLSRAKQEELLDTKIAIYNRILKLDPYQLEADAVCKKLYEKSGDIFYKNKQLEKASEAYEKASAIDKKCEVVQKLTLETLYQNALNLLDKNQKEEALKYLAQILCREPSNKEAINLMQKIVTGADSVELAKRVKQLEATKLELHNKIVKYKSAIEDMNEDKKLIKERKEESIKDNESKSISPEMNIRTFYAGKQDGSDIMIRCDPQKISDIEALEIFTLDNDWKPYQYYRYIDNSFEDHKDGTVTDHATGLMWETSGSNDLPFNKDVRKYMHDLNKKKLASYANWRLPTIEELMSLLTPTKQSNRLYIDPLFNIKQVCCISADKRNPSGEWNINFEKGIIYWSGLNLNIYVRAVRSC